MSCLRVMACMVARVLESSELQQVTAGIGDDDRGLAANLPSTTFLSLSPRSPSTDS